MKKIFLFWGYDFSAWQALVGPEKLLEADLQGRAEMKFGRVRFSREALALLKDFREDIEAGIASYIHLSSARKIRGNVLVEFQEDGSPSSIPLVTLTPRGTYLFHFDVDETVHFIQQEKYLLSIPPFYVRLGMTPSFVPAGVRKLAISLFSLSRSLLVRKGGGKPIFPAPWKDLSVDIWRFFIRAIVEGAPSRHEPLPLWPKGKRYAVILNHDVDTAWAFKNERGIRTFREMEEKRGLRSAWLVVGRLAEIGRADLEKLLEAGHEIGLHGMEHDHRTAYLSFQKIHDTYSRASGFIKDFDCVGFRNPSYHRTETLYRAIDSVIRYDMSMHDSYENANKLSPSFEGCSTCFPFTIEGTNLLEIPTTVTEDFVLEIKGYSASAALECQRELVKKIKKRRGVANILTHPEPQLTARREWIQNYDALLEEMVRDEDAWFALPREVWRWWLARQQEIQRGWEALEPIPISKIR